MAVLGTVATIVAGCGPLTPERTFEPGVEHLSAGEVHFVADPPAATTPIEIRIRGDDGRPTQQAFGFGVGAVIEDTATSVPGRLGFIMNGRPCDGDLPIEAGQTTDVTIHIGGAACSVVVAAIHPVATLPAVEGS